MMGPASFIMTNLERMVTVGEGFVYILLNPSFPDQVKIGVTQRPSKTRAKELWTTGVPTEFIVVWDELVSDCQEVERRLHERFSKYRVNRAREFFRIPVREAVRALQQEAQPFRVKPSSLTNRREILDDLRAKYADYLRPDIVAAAIIQLPGVCFLEATRRMYPKLRDEIIERIDLSFIWGADGEMFPVTNSVDENARQFIHELDEYGLVMTTPLFTEEACQAIAMQWERPGGKLDQRRSKET